MRRLEHRTNNAYDTILLFDGDTVIGRYDATARVLAHYHEPGDLADWEPSHPDNTDPADYGHIVDD